MISQASTVQGATMHYPQAVIKKAQKMEKLLQRVDAGEPLAQVCAELDVEIGEKRLAALQAKYKADGETWKALLDGRFGHTHKVHAAMLAWLYECKEQDETLRAPALAEKMKNKFGVVISPGHINYLLRKRGLTAPPGHPYKDPPTDQEEEQPPTDTESLDNAGLFFPGSSQGRDGCSADG
jgi:transposase